MTFRLLSTQQYLSFCNPLSTVSLDVKMMFVSIIGTVEVDAVQQRSNNGIFFRPC